MSIENRLDRIEALLSLKVKEVLSVKEVAALLGRTENRIRHLVSAREIPHYKNDRGQVSFRKSEIEEWQLGQRIPTNAEINILATTHTALKRI